MKELQDKFSLAYRLQPSIGIKLTDYTIMIGGENNEQKDEKITFI